MTRPNLFGVALDAGQVAPLVDDVGQVDVNERQLDLSDLVVFGEPVKVEHGKHQRLVHSVRVRQVLKSQHKRQAPITIQLLIQRTFQQRLCVENGVVTAYRLGMLYYPERA